MAKILINSDTAKANAIKQLQSINTAGGLEVIIQRHRSSRSLAQNRLYWSWLQVIAAETGNDVDALHDCMRGKFLGAALVEVLGDVRAVLPTTTKLQVAQFTEYLQRIEAFAIADLGITLPHPDDCYHEAMSARCA